MGETHDYRDGNLHLHTGRLPDKSGIDPVLLLVDRVPGDNLKSVTINK